MFKIIQARLQQYMNHEHPEVQAGFIQSRGQITNIPWIIEKARELLEKKESTSASLTTQCL